MKSSSKTPYIYMLQKVVTLQSQTKTYSPISSTQEFEGETKCFLCTQTPSEKVKVAFSKRHWTFKHFEVWCSVALLYTEVFLWVMCYFKFHVSVASLILLPLPMNDLDFSTNLHLRTLPPPFRWTVNHHTTFCDQTKCIYFYICSL